jgi:threonine dehydrogenase-like Zn-dependent dehydrogenase
VKALTFDFDWARLAAAKVLGRVWNGGELASVGPLAYEDVPDPALRGDDWVVLETRYCGICGSDVKQVFLDGALDNPVTSLISFPHVLGHEIVGTVVEAGEAVRRVRRGDRVLCYPWLSCVVRGLPPCASCRAGRLSLCQNLTTGSLAPGMHAGNCRDVPGGFAPLVAAHESMCFAVPEAVSFEAAALGDPFAVCLHAVSKSPPEPGETVLVSGCGGLGALLVHVLARLYPGVRVLVADLVAEGRALAERMGAHEYLVASGRELVERVGALTGARVLRPMFGLPILAGGVDRVYDTVGTARTLETGVRLVKPGGSIVLVGVATPARFEWTPLYFKEVSLIGSSGYGIERFEGEARHGFDVFLDLVAAGRIDPTPMISHKLPLPSYKEAFVVAKDKRRHRSVKVLFDFAGDARA